MSGVNFNSYTGYPIQKPLKTRREIGFLKPPGKSEDALTPQGGLDYYKTNFDKAIEIRANPFMSVTKDYLAQIKRMAGLDNNFGFDGRYFHIGDFPTPLDKGQKSVFTTDLKVKMATEGDPKTFHTLKYHLYLLKFLEALNRANRYLSGLAKESIIMGDAQGLRNNKYTTSSAKEQYRIKSSLGAPKKTAPNNIEKKLQVGFDKGFENHRKLISAFGGDWNAYARINGETRTIAAGKLERQATKMGFTNPAELKALKADYNSKLQDIKKSSYTRLALDTEGLKVLDTTSALISYQNKFNNRGLVAKQEIIGKSEFSTAMNSPQPQTEYVDYVGADRMIDEDDQVNGKIINGLLLDFINAKNEKKKQSIAKDIRQSEDDLSEAAIKIVEPIVRNMIGLF